MGAVLTRPWLIWTLTGVFAVRVVILSLLAPGRPDAENAWKAGHLLLTDPARLYTSSAEALARTGINPVPGQGWLYPPAAAWLAAPFGLLSQQAGVALWTLADAAALVGGLAILHRLLRPGRLGGALFWLVAAYYPPLFAEVDAGQIGGFLLLLAMASIWLAPRRPLLAGAMAGLAASVKIYPGAMLLGGLPGRWRYSLGLVAAGGLASVAAFAPLGPGGPAYYFTRVLLPSIGSRYPDCAIVSIRTMYLRGVGGEAYALPVDGGLAIVSLPLHQPVLASALAYATVLAVVGAAIWAARQSGWHRAYSLALGFSLGALVPGEVNPYQLLPLLPLVLMVTVRACQRRRIWALAGIAVGLAGLARQPCYLPFPNVWTLAALVLFATAVWHHELFGTDESRSRDGKPPAHTRGARADTQAHEPGSALRSTPTS